MELYMGTTFLVADWAMYAYFFTVLKYRKKLLYPVTQETVFLRISPRKLSEIKHVLHAGHSTCYINYNSEKRIYKSKCPKAEG